MNTPIPSNDICVIYPSRCRTSRTRRCRRASRWRRRRSSATSDRSWSTSVTSAWAGASERCWRRTLTKHSSSPSEQVSLLPSACSSCSVWVCTSVGLVECERPEACFPPCVTRALWCGSFLTSLCKYPPAFVRLPDGFWNTAIAAGTYFEQEGLRNKTGGGGHVTRVIRDTIQKRNFC